MKLVVAPLRALRTYISRELYYIISDLVEVHGWRLMEVDSLWPPTTSLRRILLAELGSIPDVILFWESYRVCRAYLPELLELRWRRCIFVEDLHMSEEHLLTRRDILLHFDTILASYEYVLDDFYPGLRQSSEIVWVPHSCSKDFIMPCAENPENAVLLSGEINRFYPLRQRMKALFEEKRYPIVYHEHPGYHCNYEYQSSPDVGQAYASKMNRCLASFVDSSIYRYVVAKYFEIPAAGSLLLADDAVKEPLRRLGFVEGRHYIGVSAGNLEATVRDLLEEDGSGRLDAMRKRAQRLVLKEHKTSDRARQIDEACRPIATVRRVNP